jgi:hypothetical protein
MGVGSWEGYTPERHQFSIDKGTRKFCGRHVCFIECFARFLLRSMHDCGWIGRWFVFGFSDGVRISEHVLLHVGLNLDFRLLGLSGWNQKICIECCT